MGARRNGSKGGGGDGQKCPFKEKGPWSNRAMNDYQVIVFLLDQKLMGNDTESLVF